MNILFGADVSIEGIVGGAERVLYEQAQGLARRGHTCRLITRRLTQHGTECCETGGLTEWRYRVRGSGGPLRFLLSTMRNGRKLFEQLHNGQRVDHLVLHQPFTGAAVLSSRQARAIPKTYVCHSLSYQEFQSRNRMPASLHGRLLYQLNTIVRRHLERHVLGSVDRIVVLSRFSAGLLQEAYGIGGDRVVIVPGGVDLDRFRPPVSRADVRRDLGFRDGATVIVTVRNLGPRMGLDVLLRAVPGLVAEAPEVQLVIGGEGPLRGELEALTRTLGIGPHVRFVGYIPEDRLPDYYGAADLFVLPTRELEGFGLVTVEALACGTPVVGTAVGGTKEVLGGFDPGHLFEAVEPEAMADLLLRMCGVIREEPRRWSELSLRARRYAEEHYSWDRHIDTLEQVILRRRG